MERCYTEPAKGDGCQLHYRWVSGFDHSQMLCFQVVTCVCAYVCGKAYRMEKCFQMLLKKYTLQFVFPCHLAEINLS